MTHIQLRHTRPDTRADAMIVRIRLELSDNVDKIDFKLITAHSLHNTQQQVDSINHSKLPYLKLNMPHL